MTNKFSYRRLFRLLVIFRWVSLLPPITLASMSSQLENAWQAYLLLIVTISVNLFITIRGAWLNESLREKPWILSIDIVYSVLLLFLSGGGTSPYYLHSLSPLLGAAFFFQIRGGALAAGIYSLLYVGLAALIDGVNETLADALRWITLFAGIWLIPAVVGELSKISIDLQSANEVSKDSETELTRQNVELLQAHERLQTIHDLTRLLQAAPDVHTMQEQALRMLAQSLRYSRALLGLIKPGTKSLHGWKGLRDSQFEADPGIPAQPVLLLDDSNYPLIGKVIHSGTPAIVELHEAFRLHPALQAWAGNEKILIVPLIFHEQAVGVLILPIIKEEGFLESDHYILIRTLSNQAATSLGTTMLCVERAQDLAVEQERNRIAREIHDTVSQSLFGMVYSLEACISMLPENGDAVKKELIDLQSLTNLTRDQVRHSIFDLWPSSLTLDIFKADLDHYVSHCFRLMPFEINYEISEEFNDLSPAIRRNLYRITQEALTNVLHHAGVDHAMVDMDINPDSMALKITDEGAGFDVENALSREYNREHFGLHGIRERTQAMGGECIFTSEEGVGSEILVKIPLKKNQGEKSIEQ